MQTMCTFVPWRNVEPDKFSNTDTKCCKVYYLHKYNNSTKYHRQKCINTATVIVQYSQVFVRFPTDGM